MTIWKNCCVDELTYGESEVGHFRNAQVSIDKGTILVAYKNDDGEENADCRGTEKAPGHFELNSINNSGRMTLHRFPDSHYLEGYWEEAGYKGFWRIKLIK